MCVLEHLLLTVSVVFFYQTNPYIYITLKVRVLKVYEKAVPFPNTHKQSPLILFLACSLYSPTIFLNNVFYCCFFTYSSRHLLTGRRGPRCPSPTNFPLAHPSKITESGLSSSITTQNIVHW